MKKTASCAFKPYGCCVCCGIAALGRSLEAFGNKAMLDRLDFMVRFWLLMERHRRPDTPLSAVERGELLSLMHLLSTDDPLPGPGPLSKKEVGFPIQLTSDTGFMAAHLRYVCSEGLVIAAPETISVAQRTIIRLADAVSGIEFTLPCRVVWAYPGLPSGMGLCVDGIPMRAPFHLPAPGVWRSNRWPERPVEQRVAQPH